jgi:hypothetical protein
VGAKLNPAAEVKKSRSDLSDLCAPPRRSMRSMWRNKSRKAQQTKAARQVAAQLAKTAAYSTFLPVSISLLFSRLNFSSNRNSNSGFLFTLYS